MWQLAHLHNIARGFFAWPKKLLKLVAVISPCVDVVFPPISCYDPIGKVFFSTFFSVLVGRQNVMSHNIFSVPCRARSLELVVSSRCGEAEVEKSSTLSDFRYITTARAGEMTQRKLKVSLISLLIVDAARRPKGSNEHFHSKKQTS